MYWLTEGRSWVGVAAVVLMAACAEEPAPPAETVRAVRTVIISEPASGRPRRFSGVVEAADSSSISFEVSGIVNEIQVDVGDRVEEGQVLAIMDDSAYRLNVEAARAAVAEAEVELADAENANARFSELGKRGAISEREAERYLANRDAAKEILSYAVSRLGLAERDLERTVLRSPFTGVVATRQVDAFQQVARGDPVLELFMEGAMEAAISVPESEMRYVYLGLPGTIRISAIPDGQFEGVVSERSNVAGAANAFPVRVLIDSEHPGLRPGVTAEVTLLLGEANVDQAYLLPISALGAEVDGSGSFVFRFNADTSSVEKVSVGRGEVRDNHMVVREGVRAGDVIVTAGVSFLRDGQKVTLLAEAG